MTSARCSTHCVRARISHHALVSQAASSIVVPSAGGAIRNSVGSPEKAWRFASPHLRPESTRTKRMWFTCVVVLRGICTESLKVSVQFWSLAPAREAPEPPRMQEKSCGVGPGLRSSRVPTSTV